MAKKTTDTGTEAVSLEAMRPANDPELIAHRARISENKRQHGPAVDGSMRSIVLIKRLETATKETAARAAAGDARAQARLDSERKALEDAKRDGQAFDGRVIILEEERDGLEAKTPQVEDAATRRAADAIVTRTAALAARNLDLLAQAEAVNRELRTVRDIAALEFQPGTRAAQLCGVAAGLPELIAFEPVVFDPHRADYSPFGTWARIVCAAGLITAERRDAIHAEARAEYASKVERAAVRVDPYEAAIADRKAKLVASGQHEAMIRKTSPRYRVIGTGTDTRTVQE
jgi:hypothetical protein